MHRFIPNNYLNKKQQGGSITDYIKASGRGNGSFATRKGIAEAMGINNYKGTASQNLDLLSKLKNQDNQKRVVFSNEDFVIENSERIAQMVISKCEQAAFVAVDILDETDRSSGGFGHSGLK